MACFLLQYKSLWCFIYVLDIAESRKITKSFHIYHSKNLFFKLLYTNLFIIYSNLEKYFPYKKITKQSLDFYYLLLDTKGSLKGINKFPHFLHYFS